MAEPLTQTQVEPSLTMSSTSAANVTDAVTDDVTSAASILQRLRRLPFDDTADGWEMWSAADWPELFRLVQVAADLPLFADNNTLNRPPADLWPELADVADDVKRLQHLVQRPTVPSTARLMDCLGASEDAARRRLEASHCVTVRDLFASREQQQLEQVVAALRPSKENSWGALQRREGPELFALFDGMLAGDAFRRLTGYRAARDTYTLTLSLQSLQREGIGWHQDLYWPKEWVGEDVFAVLYALGDDTPEKGGAFVYYEPWRNEIRAVYRQRHQVTILWNARQAEGRLLHGVSGYGGDDTARHLIILQCLRRADDG